MISRFHWHVLTLWLKVDDEDSKPCVEFTPLFHTPIAKSQENQIRYLDWGLSILERIEVVNLYAPMFNAALSSAKFVNRQSSYRSRIVEDQVPHKFVVNLSEMKAAMSMGGLPKPEDVPETLRREIWG